MIAASTIQTPLGKMDVGVDVDTNRCVFLDFSNRKSFSDLVQKRIDAWGPVKDESHPLHQQIENQLHEYFSGDRQDFDIPIQLLGTEFEQKVWTTLQTIPHGETWSYGKLAQQVGLSSGASRAVGAANGRNVLAIIIPCHRVIGADGKLVGYGGGLDRKRKLLDLEASSTKQKSLDDYL